MSGWEASSVPYECRRQTRKNLLFEFDIKFSHGSCRFVLTNEAYGNIAALKPIVERLTGAAY